MLDTREAFHFSSGITLAQSGMAEVGRVIPDITCLIRSTCSEQKQKQRFFYFILWRQDFLTPSLYVITQINN